MARCTINLDSVASGNSALGHPEHLGSMILTIPETATKNKCILLHYFICGRLVIIMLLILYFSNRNS